MRTLRIRLYRPCSYSLKVLNIVSLLQIIKYNRQEKTENILTDDQESKLIKSFFENGDKCNLTEVKWDAPIFE